MHEQGLASLWARTNVAQILVATPHSARSDLLPVAVQQEEQDQRHAHREHSDRDGRQPPSGIAVFALAPNAVVNGKI